MKNDFTAFGEMPDEARTWVYQSSRKLTDTEVERIKVAGREFISTWDYHGTMLSSAFDVLYGRFIIIMVDERNARPGGCSIDRSVALLKEIEERLNLTLLDRLTLAYMRSDSSIGTVHMNDLSAEYAANKLTDGTLVFNNTITTFSGLKNNWLIPLERSWAFNRLKVLR